MTLFLLFLLQLEEIHHHPWVIMWVSTAFQDFFSQVNLLSAKKQMTKFSLQNFKIRLAQEISYWEFKDYRAISVDLDEGAHYELPHQGLHCLQVLLFQSVILKVFEQIFIWKKKSDIGWQEVSLLKYDDFEKWVRDLVRISSDI